MNWQDAITALRIALDREPFDLPIDASARKIGRDQAIMILRDLIKPPI